MDKRNVNVEKIEIGRRWEEFAYGPDGQDDLRVTLSPKGELMIGAKAIEKMGRPDYAVLLFDRLESLMGVLPTHGHERNGYPLIHKLKGRHRLIRANKFCRHYGIKFEMTRAFLNPYISDDGILVLDLKETKGVRR